MKGGHEQERKSVARITRKGNMAKIRRRKRAARKLGELLGGQGD
jgi:hypothetical protein